MSAFYLILLTFIRRKASLSRGRGGGVGWGGGGGGGIDGWEETWIICK